MSDNQKNKNKHYLYALLYKYTRNEQPLSNVKTERLDYHIPSGCKPGVKQYTPATHPGKLAHISRLESSKFPYRCYDCGKSIEEFLMTLTDRKRRLETNRMCSECKEKHKLNSTCKSCGEKLVNVPGYSIKICNFTFCPVYLRRDRYRKEEALKVKKRRRKNKRS